MTLKYRIRGSDRLYFLQPRPRTHAPRRRDRSRFGSDRSWRIDDALRLQRETDIGSEKLARVVQSEAQALIDAIQLGVELTAIEFREIQPPAEVAAEFQAVQSERIAIETRKREAEGYAARVVPAAEAESNSLIQQATRLATDLRTRAEEEVSLFNRVHDEYVRNPGLVWNRLHLETLEGVMRDGSRFRFVDPGARLVLSPGSPNGGSRGVKPSGDGVESSPASETRP